MSSVRRTVGAAAAAMALFGLVGAAAGCAGGSGSEGAASGGGGATHASAGAAGSAEPALAPSALDSSRSVQTPVAARYSVPPARSAVIRTADLALRVPHGRFGRTMDVASSIADRMGGFVSRSSASGSRIHDGGIVLRVPAARFDQARLAIERLGHPTSETVAGVDVSQQFVDLHARLHNLGSQATALRRLMSKAVTVSDTIRVQSVLENVELQMEEIQGRLIYLRDRTAMSTITVAVHEAGKKPAPPAHASAIWKAGSRALDAATAVVAAVIVGAGIVIPVAVLALLAVLIGRLAAPWAAPLAARRRRPAGTPSDS